MKNRERIESRKNIKEVNEKKVLAFAKLWQETIGSNATDQTLNIKYNLPYPKEDFLDYLLKNNQILLHGSCRTDIETLEPHQANDREKEFGNKNGVYAVKDPLLPIFYAIQNREKIDGLIVSGVKTDPETEENKYEFKMSKNILAAQPWVNGMVYILDKKSFWQGQDDDGEFGREWVSEKPVKPLAKLEVGPKDFRFLKEIESLE